MKSLLIIAVMGAVVLVGCGGRDGGGDVPPKATVTITAANQGAVARAATEGGQAFRQSQPFAAGGGTAARSIGSTAAALRIGGLQSVIQRGLVAAFRPRRSAGIASATRPAATMSTSDPCLLSGSITTTLDDADNSESVSHGDALTLTFDRCQDSSDEVVSGAMVFTIGSVGSVNDSDVQFSGSVAFQHLSTSRGASATDVEGNVAVSAALT